MLNSADMVVGEVCKYTYIECTLETGRTHQIRAHMSHIGHPLLGDGKYGVNRDDRRDGYKYQALYAYRLRFDFTHFSALTAEELKKVEEIINNVVLDGITVENKEMPIEEAKKLAREKNISILSSLHDLNQALYFGDKFFFLKDGIIKYAGGREIITAEIIKDIFDVDMKILQVDGKTVILPA